ncbi:HPP family protein [Arcobacter sp. LA11]|uniref:CBS domain-containing protein n=1 Tax=Arcobacter sp. LA11 TaxID=1898176 RepID=UPI000934A9B6|nr:CBS domain-containing protein [Arcobacter sp. LA11]
MFAIYRNGSVGFRNTIDNLYEIKKTDAPDKVEMKPNDDTLFQEFLTSNDKKNSSKEKEAINAYKKIAHIDTSEQVYHVKDIMTKNCICIKTTNTLIEAYDRLKDYQISQIPVIDENQRIMSLINKRFILNLIIEDIDNARTILDKKIEEVYLPELITTDPITDIRRVAKVIVDFKLSAIPVVTQKDILIGIVSKTDILKAVAKLPNFQLWS